MVQQIKVPVLLLWCMFSATSAMTVLLESPPPEHVALTTRGSASFEGAPRALLAAASPSDDSAASPSGNFDSFGGFSGPKALSSLVGLADFGDLDGEFDSSGFERAFAPTPNRRADSGSFDDFAGPAAAIPTHTLRAIVPPSSAHYNLQQAPGFNAALAAAPAAAYGARSAAVGPAPRPAYIPAPTSYLPAPSANPALPVAGYPKALKSVSGAGAPLFRPAAVGALPLQQPGRAAPFYPPLAGATASGTRYSALHAASRGAGGGLGSSSRQRAVPAPAPAPAPQRGAVALGGFGFGFGSELSSSASGGVSGGGGFDFGSEEF